MRSLSAPSAAVARAPASVRRAAKPSPATSLRRAAPAPTLPRAEPATASPAPPAAAASPAASPSAVPAGETYEVFLQKPLGIRFARGRDGEAYVARSDPALGNTDPRVAAGDKLVQVSASFGADVWDAKNFGQVMYAIKTRNGEVYLKIRSSGGDTSALELEQLSDAERRFRLERGGGNYGAGTKEVQAANYAASKKLEAERVTLFDGALAKFNKKEYEGALIDFETVIAMEPPKFLGDNFARVTPVFKASQYNVACCYAAIGQTEPGLEALDAAMGAGFDDYGKVRSDPNLAPLRSSKAAFDKIINKYDEPIINEAAVAALKNLFSFGRKKADDDDDE